ncbi:hypothetical protein [Aquamicrobium zhengzhouense]|uniref:Uncharacterized protein n=1 Tax=Aquamicrobium zhengzhouense TaxID=2781738 RepID=A0ABS0SE23_9HYPH|nr:hypothetical protein [Aquamicrobium zhengzhouense]MBI1621496.1 hypothetical protein [Aquamicrobium zhengzhouense]
MKTYTVLRQHYGDKQYMAGDTREANETDVKHLVTAGVLEEVGPKSEKAPANKAEKAAPKNKSAD